MSPKCQDARLEDNQAAGGRGSMTSILWLIAGERDAGVTDRQGRPGPWALRRWREGEDVSNQKKKEHSANTKFKNESFVVSSHR